MALSVATIDAAIERLLSGAQTVSVDGMSYTQASLSSLTDLRTQLLNESGSRFGFATVIQRGPRP